MATDVGSSAIDRDLATGDGYTNIDKNNPSNESGQIDHIEIYMNMAGNVIIASFEEVSANTFTARGNSGVLTCEIGLNVFNAPADFTAFNINAGDYIGAYYAGGVKVDKTDSGDGAWYDFGDKTSCENEAMVFVADRTISLYGTGGEEPPAGLKKMVQIM